MPATPTARSAAAPLSGVLAPAAMAALLGVFVLFGVAFAGPELIHNAAHDSRHAFAFPCH
jgi:cobalt transporter subunit CbtB